jgi:hypothetical protein
VEDIEKEIRKYEFVFVSRYLGILEALVSRKYVFAVYNNEIKEDYLRMTPFARFISISNNSFSVSKEIERYYGNKKVIDQKVEDGFNWAKNKTWDSLMNLYLKLWSGANHNK